MSEPTGNESDAEDFIRYECTDRVATITLNRPRKLNAFNDDMVMRLARVLHEFDIDENADVAVLRGEGRAFCSGADVHQRQLRSDADLKKHGGSQGWNANASELFVRAINWKPIIASPHGFAVGLGLGMVLESEMIVAEAGTRFQVTETSRGLASSRYWALLRFRGAGSFATDVALTGRFFTAEEALAAGVVDRVAPQGEQLQQAYELARQMAANPPLSVRATVRTRRWYMDQAEREAYLQTTPLKLHTTEDFKESARAFAEKRKAGPFKGR
ncbi:MAG: enoyl-CoA hydratase/isomerase family protein [Burkholderiales bacterium]|nr:enoyl-CoA hydratase/isomerase family protein [Burkholderiales bacterium]